MEDSFIIIIAIAIIIVISPFIAKITKLPTTVIEILLGSISAYFSFLGENLMFNIIAEVGFFYLMFLAGAEVDLKILLNLDKRVVKIGFLYISLLYLLSLIVSLTFGLNHIFIVMMPLISVGLILALFKEYGKDEKWLSFAMTIGVLGELVSILVLTFVGAVLENGFGFELLQSLFFLTMVLLFLSLLYKFLKVLFWWFPELKLFLMPHHDKDEKDIRISLALFFLMIVVMHNLHLEVAFGAFIAGVFIATFFEHKEELPHKLESFGFGFFIPIFFIHIGSTFDLESLLTEGLALKAFQITLFMIMIRIIASMVFVFKMGIENSILISLAHSMPLTLLIAVATIAYNSDTISQFIYYAFILASLFEVIISMVTIKIIMIFRRKRESILINKAKL